MAENGGKIFQGFFFSHLASLYHVNMFVAVLEYLLFSFEFIFFLLMH